MWLVLVERLNVKCHIRSNALNTATTLATVHYFGTMRLYKRRPTQHHCLISAVDKSVPVLHHQI